MEEKLKVKGSDLRWHWLQSVELGCFNFHTFDDSLSFELFKLFLKVDIQWVLVMPTAAFKTGLQVKNNVISNILCLKYKHADMIL